MFERIEVIGEGRVGAAVSARLRERGIAVGGDGAEIVLLCVPDRAISDVAREVMSRKHVSQEMSHHHMSAGLTPGHGREGHGAEGHVWLGHVSGAVPLSALDPSERRFGVHPLQTFARPEGRAPETLAGQFDGAWAAVSGESAEALAVAAWLAKTLGLRPFELAESARPLYHAGAAIASNYLVTLQRAAASLFEAAGAPPEALVPLMLRTIENGFELTGPIARGDWETVQRHRDAIAAARPELEHLYETLASATVAIAL